MTDAELSAIKAEVTAKVTAKVERVFADNRAIDDQIAEVKALGHVDGSEAVAALQASYEAELRGRPFRKHHVTKCAYCGWPHAHDRSDARFCSKRCANSWRRLCIWVAERELARDENYRARLTNRVVPGDGRP